MLLAMLLAVSSYRCKAHNIKNTLNLHPASGIQPWEDMYKEMATAMGMDPSVRIIFIIIAILLLHDNLL